MYLLFDVYFWCIFAVHICLFVKRHDHIFWNRAILRAVYYYYYPNNLHNKPVFHHRQVITLYYRNGFNQNISCLMIGFFNFRSLEMGESQVEQHC